MGNHTRKEGDVATFSDKKRILALFSVFILVLGIVICRLSYLQIIIGDELKKKAVKMQTRDTIISPERGIIYDREKKELAVSATAYTLYAYPGSLKSSFTAKGQLDEERLHEFSDIIARILDKDNAKVYKKLSSGTLCEIVDRRIEKNKADKLRKLITKGYEGKINGLRLLEDSKRYYPHRNLASHIIGFTGVDGNGLQGIEQIYDKYLKGTPGRFIFEADTNSKELPLGNQDYVKPKRGDDVILTIDEVIQSYAESALEQALIDTGSKRGTIIAMNPKTGEILALANKPDFDLNSPFLPSNMADREVYKKMSLKEKGEYLQKMWRNFAVSDTYEPGSPFKIVTASAALEEGVVTPNSKFNCNGYIRVGNRSISCANGKKHGAQDFRKGLQNSCNVVFVTTGLRVGIDKLSKYTRDFGFGQKTGIDMNGEEKGILFDPKNMKEIDNAVMSFGQGIQVTPIGMMNAVCAIANGGKLMKPHILKQVISNKGKLVYEVKPKIVRQVVSKKTADTLSEMLEKVVSEGTGKNAKIEGYQIAGKTGTSEKLPRGSRKYVASFTGFAPYNDPKIAIIVLLDEPDPVRHFGGLIAAPVFKEVMENSLNYMGIRKNSDSEGVSDEKIVVPDYRGKKYKDVAVDIQKKGLKVEVVNEKGSKIIDQIPAPGATVFQTTTLKLILEDTKSKKSGKVIVPDLKGKTADEANKIVTSLGLKINVIGDNGVVYSQSIASGEKVSEGSEIIVTLKNTESEGTEQNKN